MELIDTHAHLDDTQFAADLDAVLLRARAARLAAIVAVGTTVETSGHALRIARANPIVHPAVGIHPNYAALCGAADWDEIVELSGQPEVVAIGETGLDRFRSDTPFEQQQDYFARHLQLSRERGLPIIIHCRDAENDALPMLEHAAQVGPLRGVMHSFTGTAATASRCVELGLYISFAGQVTYSNRKFDGLREVAAAVPADRFLIETDSPYLSPEPHRGQRNEPAYVALTAQRIADSRRVSLEELANQSAANARRLFHRLPAT
jgi:TatD DNase family protein